MAESSANFLGRTRKSWAKIAIFSSILLACLVIAVTIGVVVYKTDADRYPDVELIPRFPKESNLIWFKNGDETDIKPWVEQLDTFISDYDGRTEDGSDSLYMCDFVTHRAQMNLPPEEREQRSCAFDQLDLGSYCTKANSWGYNRDSPCVILKFNKVIGWEPAAYTKVKELPENMPSKLKNIIKDETKAIGFNHTAVIPPMVWVSCEGENPGDQEFLGDMIYTPLPGFPAYFFPYKKNARDYLSPLVAVKFVRPQRNVLINIECRLWAKNIQQEKEDGLGMVNFQLLID